MKSTSNHSSFSGFPDTNIELDQVIREHGAELDKQFETMTQRTKTYTQDEVQSLHKQYNAIVAQNKEKEKKVNELERLIERLKLPKKEPSLLMHSRLSWCNTNRDWAFSNVDGKAEEISEEIEDFESKYQEELIYTKNLTSMYQEEREALIVYKERAKEVEKLISQIMSQYENVMRAKNIAISFEIRTNGELSRFNQFLKEKRNEYLRKVKNKTFELSVVETEINDIIERMGKRSLIQKQQISLTQQVFALAKAEKEENEKSMIMKEKLKEKIENYELLFGQLLIKLGLEGDSSILKTETVSEIISRYNHLLFVDGSLSERYYHLSQSHIVKLEEYQNNLNELNHFLENLQPAEKEQFSILTKNSSNKGISDDQIMETEKMIFKLYIQLLNTSTQICQLFKPIMQNSDVPQTLQNIVEIFSEAVNIFNKGFLEKRKPSQEDKKKLSAFFKTEVEIADKTIDNFVSSLSFASLSKGEIKEIYMKLIGNNHEAEAFVKLFHSSLILTHFTTKDSLQKFLETSDKPFDNLSELLFSSLSIYQSQFRILNSTLMRIIIDSSKCEKELNGQVNTLQNENKISLNTTKKPALYPKKMIRNKEQKFSRQEESFKLSDLRNNSFLDVSKENEEEKPLTRLEVKRPSTVTANKTARTANTREERLQNTLKEFLELERKIKNLKMNENKAQNYKSGIAEKIHGPLRSVSLPHISSRVKSALNRDKTASRLKNLLESTQGSFKTANLL
ncbi:unnamed protein product [Blepharisma stoltei]|uniref:Uncharacterized protein n=1 Tax=Blepharisma stoltei TaxID=1481888 RepID=A0AAU9JPN7_9CILI|nr:unnamed protein product [Blepharisma stoltei]